MGNRNEAYQEALELVNKLQALRKQQVQLENQIHQLDQKKALYGLDLKRLEAKKILEVQQGTQSNGQPLVQDIQVKRAMVEDLLAHDKIAIALLHKIRLAEKHSLRKGRKYGLQQAEIDALESKEKLLILQAT